MTQLETTLIASAVGATVGAALGIVSMIVNSWITQRRERRQQVWQAEIDRIIKLEERSGQLIESVVSCGSTSETQEHVAGELQKLKSEAGRFRRHRAVMQAIRDLHNGLSRVLDDKLHYEDHRRTLAEVEDLFDGLVKELDSVTGPRRI